MRPKAASNTETFYQDKAPRLKRRQPTRIDKQHHIVSKLGSFLKRAFIASTPLFGAAKSTQYPPSPFDMIVAITSHDVRIISSHMNGGWNEKPTTYVDLDDSSQVHAQIQAALEQLRRPHPSFQHLAQLS